MVSGAFRFPRSPAPSGMASRVIESLVWRPPTASMTFVIQGQNQAGPALPGFAY